MNCCAFPQSSNYVFLEMQMPATQTIGLQRVVSKYFHIHTIVNLEAAVSGCEKKTVLKYGGLLAVRTMRKCKHNIRKDCAKVKGEWDMHLRSLGFPRTLGQRTRQIRAAGHWPWNGKLITTQMGSNWWTGAVTLIMTIWDGPLTTLFVDDNGNSFHLKNPCTNPFRHSRGSTISPVKWVRSFLQLTILFHETLIIQIVCTLRYFDYFIVCRYEDDYK